MTDSLSAPMSPVGALPAADSTSAKSAIITTAMVTQRFLSAMRISAPAPAITRVIPLPSG